MTGHSILPLDALPAAWASLSPDQQSEVGHLALARALHDVAAEYYEGDEPGTTIVYVDADGRDASAEAAGRLQTEIINRLGDFLPDVYGANPAEGHPLGKEPAWVVPIVLSDVEVQRKVIT